MHSTPFTARVCLPVPACLEKKIVLTPLHSGKSGLSCTTSVGPAQYMREEMLTPSPPPNWGLQFSAPPEPVEGEMEFKDEVRGPFGWYHIRSTTYQVCAFAQRGGGSPFGSRSTATSTGDCGCCRCRCCCCMLRIQVLQTLFSHDSLELRCAGTTHLVPRSSSRGVRPPVRASSKICISYVSYSPKSYLAPKRTVNDRSIGCTQHRIKSSSAQFTYDIQYTATEKTPHASFTQRLDPASTKYLKNASKQCLCTASTKRYRHCHTTKHRAPGRALSWPQQQHLFYVRSVSMPFFISHVLRQLILLRPAFSRRRALDLPRPRATLTWSRPTAGGPRSAKLDTSTTLP